MAPWEAGLDGCPNSITEGLRKEERVECPVKWHLRPDKKQGECGRMAFFFKLITIPDFTLLLHTDCDGCRHEKLS